MISLALIAINNFIRILKQSKAERKFIDFLKKDAYYQFHSKVRPAEFNYARYQKLFLDMLDRDRELEYKEFAIIRDALTQSSFYGSINYMVKLWYASKVQEESCLACTSDESN
jgi:hypothetical protein